MGLDDNNENWNKENFTKRTLVKTVNFRIETTKKEPFTRKFPFNLSSSYSHGNVLPHDDQNDQWIKFKNWLNDDNLSDSEIFNELLELTSWYDQDSDNDDYDDDISDEEIEMIKRNVNSQIQYTSSPMQQQQKQQSSHGNTNTSVKLVRHSSSLSLSSLRLSSSTNLSKRRQMDEPNSSTFSCPSKRPFTPFQSHRKSSINLDDAISCAAQNLEVDLPALCISPPPASTAPKLERKNSDFWNEMDSVTF